MMQDQLLGESLPFFFFFSIPMSPAAEFRKDSNHLDRTISTSDNIKIFLPGSCVLKRLCTVKSTSETHFKTIIFTHLGS